MKKKTVIIKKITNNFAPTVFNSENEYLKLLNDFTNNTLLFSEYSFVNIQSLSGNKTSLIDFLYEMKSFYADTIIWQKQKQSR